MEEEVANSYLTFKVNDGTYGIQVSKVVEILAYEEPKAKTNNIDYMLGLIEHRGRVLPLIDSGQKFGMGKLNIDEQTYVIVIAVTNGDELFDVALAVDMVRDVVIITDEKRKQIETSYKPGYVLFVSPVDDSLGIFIEPDLVFSDTDIISMAKITAEINKEQGQKKA